MKVLEFPFVVERVGEEDREVFVRAEVCHVSGEPGSAGICAGWEISSCTVTAKDGAILTDDATLTQCEDAVRAEAEKIRA